MSIPLQFASLYGGQEVFVWSDCLLNLGTDFLVGSMVFKKNFFIPIPNILTLNIHKYIKNQHTLS